MASPMIPPDGPAEFLVACGWAEARIEPLAGDASFRRYSRVIRGSEQAVLMDAPPPHEDPRPFIAVGFLAQDEPKRVREGARPGMLGPFDHQHSLARRIKTQFVEFGRVFDTIEVGMP